MENQDYEHSDKIVAGQSTAAEKSNLEKKYGTIGWALFFIWIGIGFLVNFSIGLSLLGIGIITLGVQIARKSSGLKAEWFWIVVGLLFTLGGLWELFEPDMPLVPVLLIVAGVVLLLSIAMGKKKG